MKTKPPTFPKAKALSKLSSKYISQELRKRFGDVRGLSVHSVRLWSSGKAQPPWWARDAIAYLLGVPVVRDLKKRGPKRGAKRA